MLIKIIFTVILHPYVLQPPYITSHTRVSTRVTTIDQVKSGDPAQINGLIPSKKLLFGFIFAAAIRLAIQPCHLWFIMRLLASWKNLVLIRPYRSDLLDATGYRVFLQLTPMSRSAYKNRKIKNGLTHKNARKSRNSLSKLRKFMMRRGYYRAIVGTSTRQDFGLGAEENRLFLR